MLRSPTTQGNESSCGMRPNRRRARWGRSSITILVDYSIRAASNAAGLASKRGAVSLGFRDHTHFGRCLCSETLGGTSLEEDWGDPQHSRTSCHVFSEQKSPEGMSVD